MRWVISIYLLAQMVWGKSNFISFLVLLKQIANKNLQGYIAEKGGANNFLYFGRKISPQLGGSVYFDNNNAFHFELKPDSEDCFRFSKEVTGFYSKTWHAIPADSQGHKESKLDELIIKSRYKKRWHPWICKRSFIWF